MLNEKDFLVLNYCRKYTASSQREMAAETNLSVGSVNAAVKECKANGWLTDDYKVTDEGLAQLAPYKVDNAVIMAAGMSSRFAPLSYEKPKGLLVVKEEILIERQIKQLREAGIQDIIIVVGYMKEKFFYLERKFGVKLVVNEEYYRYNNPSTLMLVAEQLGNTYICSSDNYFVSNVFDSYVYKPYYSVELAEDETNEYCVQFNESGLITNVTIGGPAGSWFMIGHVYFTRDFSKKFVAILKDAYKNNPTCREELWENLYAKNIKQLPLYVKKYEQGTIQEFDSLEELRSFDKNYVNNTNSSILKNICNVLHCEEKDIIGIEAIKKGLTNTSFKFECNGKKYVYRHPGIGTDEYIHRRSEEFSMKVAKKLQLDDTYIYMDPAEGWKISHYVDQARNLDYHNEDDVRKALTMVKRLHDANIKSEFDFDIKRATQEFIDKISAKGRDDFADFEELYQTMQELYALTEKDGVEKRLCHCDCYDPNFLVDQNGKMYLIDWEYSGNDDPANDMGTFICCSDYTYDEAMNVLKIYFGRELTKEEARHYIAYIAIAAYYWFIWAIFQETIGNNVGEYLHIWYKDSLIYSEKALDMYKN